MNEQDYIQLTLFQGDSHASPLVWLENKKEKGMTVTYGRKCSELSENLRQVGLLVRTYLESCELPGKQFVRTWSVRDTLSPFLILKLRLSERRTDEKECSLSESVPLWKTPVTADANNREFYRNSRGEPNLSAQVKVAPNGPPPRCQKMWRTPDAHCDRGASSEERMKMKLEKGMPMSLNDQVAHPSLMWPTPIARDYKGGRTPEKSAEKGRNPQTDSLADAVRAETTGQLNPTWVEWLMGFPTGWTDISE